MLAVVVEWAVGDTRRIGVSNSHVVRLVVIEMENEVGVGMFWVEFIGLGEKLMGLERERGGIQNDYSLGKQCVLVPIIMMGKPDWGGDRNQKFCFADVHFEMPGRCPNRDVKWV